MPLAKGVERGANSAFVAYASPLVFWIFPVMTEGVSVLTRPARYRDEAADTLFTAWLSHHRGIIVLRKLRALWFSYFLASIPGFLFAFIRVRFFCYGSRFLLCLVRRNRGLRVVLRYGLSS